MVVIAPSVQAWSLDTELTFEYRYFLNDPLLDKQHGNNLSAALDLRFVEKWRRGREKIVFQPYYRHDINDDERTHFDLREFYYVNAKRAYEYSVGVRKIFWGVTESQHLVDIINQTDAVENIDGEDKLGQPMFNFAWITRDYGTFSVYALAGFRERTFVGPEGRPRIIPKISNDDAIYESGAEEYRLDGAVRWSITLGDWDIGLSHFSGTSREPNFQLRFDFDIPNPPLGLPPELFTDGPIQLVQGPTIDLEFIDDNVTLIPEYRVIDQTGLDINGIVGAWIFKLEAITRSGQGELRGEAADFGYDTHKRYYASTAGVEYTLYQLFGSDADLGLIAEYSYDSRGDDATSLFEDDIFVGGRLALNDVDGTAVLFGAFYDRDDHALFYSLEASRRLTSTLSLSIEGRWFSNIQPDDYPLNIFANEDYIQTELIFYF